MAAKRVYSNQRLAFVTGDRLLFSAYRRWYASLKPGCALYYQSFLLRRAPQYLPVFNIADSDNDISKGIEGHVQTREIFARLLSLIEIVLLPLNLLQYTTVGINLKRMDVFRRHHRMSLAPSYLGVIDDDEVLLAFRENLDER